MTMTIVCMYSPYDEEPGKGTPNSCNSVFGVGASFAVLRFQLLAGVGWQGE